MGRGAAPPTALLTPRPPPPPPSPPPRSGAFSLALVRLSTKSSAGIRAPSPSGQTRRAMALLPTLAQRRRFISQGLLNVVNVGCEPTPQPPPRPTHPTSTTLATTIHDGTPHRLWPWIASTHSPSSPHPSTSTFYQLRPSAPRSRVAPATCSRPTLRPSTVPTSHAGWETTATLAAKVQLVPDAAPLPRRYDATTPRRQYHATTPRLLAIPLPRYTMARPIALGLG